MHFARLQLVFLLALFTCAGVVGTPAQAFIIFIDPNSNPLNHWLTTASGTRTANGDPATLTWSLVPDGTSIVDATFGNLGSSDLIASLDAQFGGDPNDLLSERPWFDIFADSFNRWGELSGATYIFEPNDDGATAASSSPPGVLGVRGDVRIAGAFIDDPNGQNTLAFNNFPQEGGDMVLDTANMIGDDFGNPANGFRFFRNTLMHEHGHGFGIRHVNSTTDALLMETSISTTFDGPQLDEVRAIQFYFGDANEESNGGLGNETAALATDLGGIAVGGSTSVGSDADVPSQAISPTATDFVSIANLGDTDFYSFDVSEPVTLTATLTPRGGQFTQALPPGEGGGTPALFNASARSDLALAILDTDGTTILDSANDMALGGTESLVDLILPAAGEYYARVIGGPQDTIQLYELELSITGSVTFLAADFDTDGDVDHVDLATWEAAYGVNALGDADEDGDSDGFDFLIWQQQFTGSLPLSGIVAVPEPGASLLWGFALHLLSSYRRRKCL